MEKVTMYKAVNGELYSSKKRAKKVSRELIVDWLKHIAVDMSTPEGTDDYTATINVNNAAKYIVSMIYDGGDKK
jgi:hypothetical protein